MDTEEHRTELSPNERNNDGCTKYTHISESFQCETNKSYHDIGSNSLAKVDVPSTRPCAVIGPDRVVSRNEIHDSYLKKVPIEPWIPANPTYRCPPEYPTYKMHEYPHSTGNISPRQTFQENMQRVMVPPRYNVPKVNEDSNFNNIDRNFSLQKKLNVPSEVKYCDVPYNNNPVTNEHKNVRNQDLSVSHMSKSVLQSAPQHGWSPTGATVRPTRHFVPAEIYHYQDYSSCAGPRPIVRPQRTMHDESLQMFSDPYYHDRNPNQFKPYPVIKERYPQPRYEYFNNYSNPYYPPPFPPPKYDMHKTIAPPHPYHGYQQVPIKYIDNRVNESSMENFQRHNQHINFNPAFRNQVVHPAPYGSMPGNCLPNKIYPYASDPNKLNQTNKLIFDNNLRTSSDFDTSRNRSVISENYYVNDISRQHVMKSQIFNPNYQSIQQQSILRKDNAHLKNIDYTSYRNFDSNKVNNSLMRLTSQFSPSGGIISPESNMSIDISHNFGIGQEDYGYISQSSSISGRNLDYNLKAFHNDPHRKYEYRYGHTIQNSISSKISNPGIDCNKEKKGLDVRQFLQMWSEGDDENVEHNNKETGCSSTNTTEVINDQGQLYVLGLVNVPSEELSKYEHIQKVSKLPENIKGYNSIELLNQFEEVIESSNINNINPNKLYTHGQIKKPKIHHEQGLPRPISPLDVEAKISQSVIHKEVGCNFEIKPCSPKMLNVEIPAPVQSILGEREIERVTNPVIIKSNNVLHSIVTNNDSFPVNQQDQMDLIDKNNPSCQMIETRCPVNDKDCSKSDYTLQELENNSSICLASLPRLDNDMELNFPEVNQQFMNANNIQSTATSKDLPLLDADESSLTTFDEKDDTKPQTSVQCVDSTKPPDSENEFVKLSKYRKVKSNVKEPSDNQSQIRTDSVIMTNPENANKSVKFINDGELLHKGIVAENINPLDLTSNENIKDNFTLNSLSNIDKINNSVSDVNNTKASELDKKGSNKELKRKVICNKEENMTSGLQKTTAVTEKKEEVEDRSNISEYKETMQEKEDVLEDSYLGEDLITNGNGTLNESLDVDEEAISINRNPNNSFNSEINIQGSVEELFHDMENQTNDTTMDIESSHMVNVVDSENNECHQDSSINNNNFLIEHSIDICSEANNLKPVPFRKQNADNIDSNNFGLLVKSELDCDPSDICLENNSEPENKGSNEGISKNNKDSQIKYDAELHLPIHKSASFSKINYNPILQNLELYKEGFFGRKSFQVNEILSNENLDKREESISNDDIDSDLCKKKLKITSPLCKDSDSSLGFELKTERSCVVEPDQKDFILDSVTLNSVNDTNELLNTNVLGQISLPTVQETGIETKSSLESFIDVNSTDLNHFPAFASPTKRKRSYSDSCLNGCRQNSLNFIDSILCSKRRKLHEELFPTSESKINLSPGGMTENVCSLIQNHRRKSVSSIYKEENVSFCILIDSCIIAEDHQDVDDTEETIISVQDPEDIINCEKGKSNDISNVTNGEQLKNVIDIVNQRIEETWIDDVACIETIESDDIAEDVIISASSSPKYAELTGYESNNEESGIFSASFSDHSDKVRFIYGEKMSGDDAEFLSTLCETPHMNINKTFIDKESHVLNQSYETDNETKQNLMEKVETEINIDFNLHPDNKENEIARSNNSGAKMSTEDVNYSSDVIKTETDNVKDDMVISEINMSQYNEELCNLTQDDTVHSCESSVDNVFTYCKRDEIPKYSSSPEVSSTTSEEKNSTILLKITKHKGSRISHITDTVMTKNHSLPDSKDCDNFNSFPTTRPLITKAAQKYIPPLKETIGDLKVKLPLPKQSLLKLKQLKMAKVEPKSSIVRNLVLNKPEIPKKAKPKFEDVLKSIDEIQFKLHKEKSKKLKKSIPKVVIKKCENGSHYASTTKRDAFNPDLTGRKWQPWVFLEKNGFIDNMALKGKSKAIYSHRKKTFVLTENFKRYKAISSKFLITQQSLKKSSSGHLKYTIRLQNNR